MTAGTAIEPRPEPRGLAVQRRLVELGRIRLGQKGSRGEPKKLEKFRLTSASREVLEAAARLYGGTVRSWQGAPDEGMWELYTETAALDVMVPPVMNAYSQYYEVWDAGGCTLRCDGFWESIAEEPCSHGDHSDLAPNGQPWKVTTRVSVILPNLPGLGVWRLETHGWNAAATLPSSLDLIGAAGKWIPAQIRLEQRSSRTRDEKTNRVLVRRFVVPVLDIQGMSFAALLAAGQASDDYTSPAVSLPPRDVAPRALPAPAVGPHRPAYSQKVDRPELAPEPPLEDEAAPFVIEATKPFPDEAPEPAAAPPEDLFDPEDAIRAPRIDAETIATLGARNDMPLDETIKTAAAASDLTGPATKEQLIALGALFSGWDKALVGHGLQAAFGNAGTKALTAAQAHALIVVGESLGDRLAPAWNEMVAEHAH
jgi:hypothetical protein